MSTTTKKPALLINGEPYEVVIGIECHVELKTETKMFCGCRNVFGSEPNTNVCPVCLGLPGALPVPNTLAIELLVKAGLAFGADIPAFSKFDRKNYFYPDMPKDYQISQYDTPTTQGGTVTYWLPDGTQGKCNLTRIHLEEDTGKSTHAGSADGRLAGSTYSLVDFNRAGVPLMECVSEPELRNAQEAVAYLEALKRTFVALGVSDVKMEEGSLRCDVNLSLRPAGSTEFGTKVETKNLNSFNSVGRAIEGEIARQAAIIGSGGTVVQETRGWNESTGTTHTQRSKEQAHDYRYFPDPDLTPMEFSRADVERFRSELAPLPQARIDRLILHDKLSVAIAHQLVEKPKTADFYDSVVEITSKPQASANFILGDVSRLANETGIAIENSQLQPKRLAEIIDAFASGAITSKVAKDMVARFWESDAPRQYHVRLDSTVSVFSDEPLVEIIKAEGLGQVSDMAAIDSLVAEILAANEKTVADYKAGKTKVMGFLVGQVMKASKGKANPTLAEERLQAALGG